MTRLLSILGVLAALTFAACGDDDDPATTAAAPAAEEGEDDSGGSAENAGGAGGGEKQGGGKEKEDDADGTEIEVSSSQFGSMLFDGDDQAIYLFDKETSSKPGCYGACAEAWPPVVTKGDPVAASGADAKLLGTTERDDGSTQVTYNGHPLYYYAHEGPGEVLCHGVDEFGGLWLVVDAAGNALPA